MKVVNVEQRFEKPTGQVRKVKVYDENEQSFKNRMKKAKQTAKEVEALSGKIEVVIEDVAELSAGMRRMNE